MTASGAHRHGRQWVAGLVCLLAVVSFAATTDAQRGRGRGGVSVMQLSIPAWPDGGMIPATHSQAGGDLSPAISWTGTPEGAVSFVLIARDVDAGNLLQWLVWNIPATSTGLPEGLPAGPEQENGVRQISVSGPYYRGPAPPPTDPPHHYMFELFALDAEVNVRPNGESAAGTLAAVEAAMDGHVRGRATYVGRFGG